MSRLEQNLQAKPGNPADGKTVVLYLGQRKASIGNQETTLDTPAKIVPPGRTVVSLRFLSEAFGKDVKWFENGRMAATNEPWRRMPGPTPGPGSLLYGGVLLFETAKLLQALKILAKRGVDLHFIKADLLVRWSGGRVEVLQLEDVLQLAKIAEDHPAAGDVVIESLWRSERSGTP
ncbi:MAG: Copper amine oxidase domain protein [Clostridia bacterium 62_21]|nr:MAG: Copper amine oxidase domain protein [Clostridia bacterium 62_21]HAG06976.1 hypothetical protein [Peptococcaceae bacterium]